MTSTYMGKMKKRKVNNIFLGILITFILLISLAHMFIHVLIFQTNIPLVETMGISGNSIGPITIDETFEINIRENYKKISPISKGVLIGEWVLLIALSGFSIVRTRIHFKHDSLETFKISRQDKSKTDIDLLYDLLKEKKRLEISSIARVFNVDKETVKEWGEIMEDNDLVVMEYPRFGDPEITLMEEENGEKAQENKASSQKQK